MEASCNSVQIGSLEETVARMNLMETRMSQLEESVNTAVGTLLPKVETLLSERNQEEGSTSSASTSTAAAPPTSLLELAERGDGETLLRMLADEQVDIRNNPPRTKNGDTAVHVAASGGHLKAVMALLGAGAQVDVLGHRLRTPLHCAAAHGHLAVAQRLLDAGAKVDVKDVDGATALELAVRSKKEIVELFLQNKMTVDSCNEKGVPLLVQTAQAKRWEMMELLLEKGASATKCTADEECALVFASKDGQADAVRHLLRRGAASNALQVELALGEATSADVVWAFVDVVPDQVRGKAGGWGFREAGCRGRLEPMIALLEVGVDINSQDNLNQTALYLASANGHIACVRELLQRGADASAKDKNGDTPLHKASMKGHVECVRALLAAGASTTERNKEVKTPLEVAKTDEVRCVFNGQWMPANNLH